MSCRGNAFALEFIYLEEGGGKGIPNPRERAGLENLHPSCPVGPVNNSSEPFFTCNNTTTQPMVGHGSKPNSLPLWRPATHTDGDV